MRGSVRVCGSGGGEEEEANSNKITKLSRYILHSAML